MIKKMAIMILLAAFLFCSTESVHPASEGGGGGIPRVLSIAAAAFRPEMKGYTYSNTGFWLEHTSFDGSCPSCNAFYYAPVHLPHYAAITGLSAEMYDLNASRDGYVRLIEADLATGLGSNWIATVSSVGHSGGFTRYTDSGKNQLVDNQAHAYYLLYWTPEEQTPSDEIMLGGVQISYRENVETNPTYYSLTGADFTPFSQEDHYTNSGARFESSGIVDRDFQAGVNLPNGARLDRLTFYYWGTTTTTVSANLAKVNLNGTYFYVGGVTSALAAGNGSGNSTAFTSNEVNNNSFAYWLFYRFANGPKAYGVSIQYTPRYSSTDETLFSISAANFVPSHGNYTYQNTGGYLVHLSGGTGNAGNYVAPFAPPTDSSLKLMSFAVGNSVNSTPGELSLLNLTDARDVYTMWLHETLASGGWYTIGSSNINRNPIDYQHNTYYLLLNLPASSYPTDWVYAEGAKGQWAYRVFLPVVKK
jgi:hypothetical protein